MSSILNLPGAGTLPQLAKQASELSKQYEAIKEPYESAVKLAKQYKEMIKPLEGIMELARKQSQIYRGAVDLQETVTHNLKSYMTEQKVNQQQLAEALGLNASTVSQKMTKRVNWTLDDIEKASEFFKVNPEALVAGSGFEPETSGL